ncbi:terpene synthase family protein [Amycolatopsis pithecellobii]|uniref:terpene synthase family protein n=1 Tax=Amycolatopsis pithecellobii TaxID=664692 RepID=UPI00140BCF55|nr:hypothetical protein [Amycolatopsis pithecellobii]
MAAAPAVRIPPLSCPLPTALHYAVDQINKDGLDWICRFVQFTDNAEWERYAAMKPGYLPGYVMPRAPLMPALQTVANLLFWLWAYDDLECDEVGDRRSVDDHILQLSGLARIVEAPQSGRVDNPFLASLADLRAQLVRIASTVQVARWASAMQLYFMANAAAAIQRANGTIPDLDTYVAQRIHSGAVKPCLLLLDLADGYELPTPELENTDVQALNEMVCTLVGWDNDLLTYHKEVVRGGADHNLVTVLANARGYAAEDAVRESVHMRERVMRLYLRLHAQVHANSGPLRRKYLAGLSSWVRGHLDWGMRTVRYRDAGADLPDRLAAEPVDLDPSPLPIASIEWWWDRLDPAFDYTESRMV